MDADEYKALIISTVNDTSGVIAANIDSIWSANEFRAGQGLYVQYLYSLRQAILVLMGEVRKRVTFQTSGNLSANQSDLIKNLQIMLTAVDGEINKLGDGSSPISPTNSGGAVGQLVTQAPISPPVGYLDGNDRAYRGDLYRRRRRV